MLGIHFAIFKEGRLYFSITFLKAELLKPQDQQKKVVPHALPPVLQGIRNGALARRQDVTSDFRREYPTT